MEKNLYIFRHGETDWNKNEIFQGQSCDVELNEKGISQALQLVDKMKDIKLDVIISSPLKRAFQTATILANAQKIQIIKNDKLKEVSFGLAEGKPYAELNPNDMERHFDWSDMEFVWESGEPRKQAQDRIIAALNDIIKLDYGTFGIATHGALIGNLLMYFGMNVNKVIPLATPIHIQFANNKFNLLYTR